MVTNFPFANGLIETCFEVFRGSSKTLLQFVPLIFIGRIILTKMTFGGSQDYRNLLKELLFLYVGFFIFQEVMEFVMSTPEMAAGIIKKPETINIESKSSWFSSLFDFDLVDMVNMISSLIYWCVCFCYLILMGFMITIGAYIILFSSLLRMQWMIKAYMSLVLILSMWPFVWYTVDQTFVFVIKGLEGSNSGTAVLVAKLISAALKIFVPALGLLAAMKAPVAGVMSGIRSVKEGSSPFRGAASIAHQGTKKVGRSLGVDAAVESFRRDPVVQDEKRRDKMSNRKYQLNDVAPMAAFGVRKAFGQLPDSTHQVRSGHGTTQTEKKKMGFQEFKESSVINLDKRRSIKAHNRVKFSSNSQHAMSTQFTSSQTLDTRANEKLSKMITHSEAHKFSSKENTEILKKANRHKVFDTKEVLSNRHYESKNKNYMREER